MNLARATMEARNPAVNTGSMSGLSRQPSGGSASRSPISSSSTYGGASTSTCMARQSATRTAVLSGSVISASVTPVNLHRREKTAPGGTGEARFRSG